MLTASHNYFEDFQVGDCFEHVRGRTVTDFDNYVIAHMSMNTAQAHFNLPYAQTLLDGAFKDRLVLGPCTIGIVVGLTSQDMSENAVQDVGMTAIRLPNPVFAGDTLYASSEVLALADVAGRPDVGEMRYRFSGRNQKGQVVAEGERTVLLSRRPPACVSNRAGGAS